MLPTINGVKVPEGLYNKATALKRQGGKVFLELPEIGDIDGCPNCRGSGNIGLLTVIGGPFDHPVPVRKPKENDPRCESNIWNGGAWLKVLCNSYPCPICAGAIALAPIDL